MTKQTLSLVQFGWMMTFTLTLRAATLPQNHEYQVVLRDFMATLTESDFDHGVTEPMSQPPDRDDPEVQYRNYLLTLMHQPLVGSKRGVPSINAPARIFMLRALEGSNQGVLLPPVWPEALMSVTQWDYAGNPYFDNRALKLRAFVTATVMMIMTDDYLDRHPDAGLAGRHGYQLVYWGSPFPGFKDLLPASVRQAYAAGLQRMAERVMEWGPRGVDAGQDVMSLVGLLYARQAVADNEFQQLIDTYIGGRIADPDFFHPAGYFVEDGGMDAGFAGMANLFGAWLALMSNRSDMNDAVQRMYRLRAHLIIPEPDGSITAPTHFHTRSGMPAFQDQWSWGGARDAAAAMVTDEAVHLVPLPSPETLAGAADRRARTIQGDVDENPVDIERTRAAGGYVYYANDEIESQPWLFSHVHQRADRDGLWRMFMTYNFPASVNPGYEFYRDGTLANLRNLAEANSPMLKNPYERGEPFVRNFSDAFVAVNQNGYRAVLHTGPVGPERSAGGPPAGFGGGQLSAFSTPAAGAVLMGRRNGRDADLPAAWREWPIHAVSGVTAAGKVFSSARIRQPEVATDSRSDGTAVVTVQGLIPPEQFNQDGPVLHADMAYRRVFTVLSDGIRVETTLRHDGTDILNELYETLPVFLREGGRGSRGQPDSVTATIEFQAGSGWITATPTPHSGITAIRINRFNGAAEIRFDTPQTVRLSPAEWADTHLSRAVCRTILIDWLETAGQPGTIDGEKTVAYTIRSL